MTLSADYWRQSGIVSTEALSKLHVSIAGVGGIGTPTAWALGKMGVGHLTLFDPDTVENHNLPNQLYRLDDIGQSKVEMLARDLRAYGAQRVDAHQGRFDAQYISGIVVSGVDSMTARKEIWDALQTKLATVPFYLEARMGGELGYLYIVRMKHDASRAWYATKIKDDSEVDDEPCTERAIIYNTFFIAAVIARVIKAIVCDEPLPDGYMIDTYNLRMLPISIPK